MSSLTEDLSVFIITNGRSTFKNAQRCLMEQEGYGFCTEISNMVWVDALNKMVNDCETKYFIRCDDDFMLHRNAIEFIYQRFIEKTEEKTNIIMGLFKLWEVWSKRVIGGIKIYRTKFVKELGGFEANYRGKVDGLFSKKVKNSKYIFTGDKKSVVGLHTMGTLEEQMKYANLWSNIADKPYIKWKPDKITTKQMKLYKNTLDNQYLMTKEFLERKNKEVKSDFHKFLRKKRREQND